MSAATIERGASIAAVVLALVALGGCGDDPKQGAIDACEGWVRDQLTAPTTADFVNVDASDFDHPFTVTGDVDTDNGFGAHVRLYWHCEAQRDGDSYSGSADVVGLSSDQRG